MVRTSRTQGFKYHGEYGPGKGLEVEGLGYIITTIFDPSAGKEIGLLSGFAEPQDLAEFSTFKRGH